MVCQAGIEDTANYMLLRTNTIGLRYVSEREIEVGHSVTTRIIDNLGKKNNN